MIDLHLRAESEADLAAALPMLRGRDRAGAATWIASGTHHALDVGFAIDATPPVYGVDGLVTVPAVPDPHFHANLRVADDGPDRAAILAAAEPYVVSPQSPRRVFA